MVAFLGRVIRQRRKQRLPRGTAALPVLLLGTFLAAQLAHFAFRGDLYLTFFVDDFYYYLVVAKNLALHGASTFNGIQSTNGYHPLWLATLTVLYRLCGVQLCFFPALTLLIWLLVCGSYGALRRAQSSLGIGFDVGMAGALLSITLMAVVSRSGMEVSLALFFLSTFWARMSAQPLESQTKAAAGVSGLLASALILSRIDACLVVAAYGMLTFFNRSSQRRKTVQRLFWFGTGLLPVAIYSGINEMEYKTILPISGIAKNLKQTWMPSLSSVRILALPRPMNILFTWPSLVLCVIFLVILLPHYRNAGDVVGSAKRRVQVCVALHPIMFYGVLSCSGDWPMWWIWYLYPLVPVWALLGPPLVSRWRTSHRTAGLWMAVAAACVGLVVVLDRVGLSVQAVYPLQRAQLLRSFAAAHPGRYAIGDAAGLAAYLMPVPVLQLEGLMADKDFVDRIRRQEPLLQALAELKVDYYVTIRAEVDGACYDVREPAQAGPRSPVMLGRLCRSPVADFRPAGDPNHAMVFDVRSVRAGAQGR